MANSRLYPCTAIIGILFGTTVASAADLPARPYTKAPPLYHAPISWTGCYLGGNIGAGWDRFNAGEVGFAGVPTPFLDYGSNNGSGLRGGGQIGCDYQFASNWVIGIQGKAEFGDINSSNPVAAFPGITAAFKLKNTETLTARLGYAFAPTVLGYVKGDAAWANAYAAATALGLAGETASFNMTGYTRRRRRLRQARRCSASITTWISRPRASTSHRPACCRALARRVRSRTPTRSS